MNDLSRFMLALRLWDETKAWALRLDSLAKQNSVILAARGADQSTAAAAPPSGEHPPQIYAERWLLRPFPSCRADRGFLEGLETNEYLLVIFESFLLSRLKLIPVRLRALAFRFPLCEYPPATVPRRFTNRVQI
jgi:hypothetical protein